MTDTRTREKRREIMAAVRQKDTEPELVLRRALHARGIRGWRCNYGRASGRPDVAWPALGLAVFVDGAFWHGHPSRHKPGRSGAYWDEKIAGNVARDRRVDAELQAAGWEVLRAWDFEVRRELESVIDRVEGTLADRVRMEAAAPAEWQQALLERTVAHGSSTAAAAAQGTSGATARKPGTRRHRYLGRWASDPRESAR